MQGVFRNPLADPFVLGTVSGATLGAALVVLFHHENTLWALPLGAFAGALLSTVILLLASELRLSLYFDQGSLILVGVALGSLLSALTGIALFASRTDQVQSLVYWLFGSFAMSQWPTLMLVTICAIPTAILLLRSAQVLDLLSLGDAMAVHLGLDVKQHKRRLLLLSSLLTALVVAACGTIGFVGLVVPHIMRRLLGPGHRRLLVAAILFGGAFLPLCDTAARTLLLLRGRDAVGAQRALKLDAVGRHDDGGGLRAARRPCQHGAGIRPRDGRTPPGRVREPLPPQGRPGGPHHVVGPLV